MEDADLVQLCQNGDMAAFDQLFHKYQEPVYRIVYRMMNDQEDAIDMTQDIFVRIFQKISSFKFKSAFSTWLYRLAMNMCIDELRKRKSTSIIPLEKVVLEAGTNTPEEKVILKERHNQIYQCLDLLKEKERAIIILKDIEGLSYKEIADILKCSLGRVKSRLHEARKKLRNIMENKTDLWAD